ncbi:MULTISPECIES: GNAT family N-acetyltransferase [Nocardiaceae]|uniref:CelD/BcsL family acetyltransferase involved in cellulose biosynthesis n=1 Tax=Rhodococcoides corynebacterioides TaxID=53972 RepID=A0ABS2KWK1_9NOCA|nr:MULTISPECIES: GNAT family N-acetyltransferase [Rhodococcus]MBM7416292.1 CelD/BcsL family acetyltransferase involved in cellulose biosynthesis [Rhodococcus corynebacterioides]MBP1114545.1 CelD/BcsL family acetyltransferase involved in cellulose biosynthesis [Rhodococcus sp. PvP016]
MIGTGSDSQNLSVRFHSATRSGAVCTDRLWEQWLDLADRVGRHVAARPEYSVGSLRLRRTRRPLIVTVHRGGHLVALAPFVVRRYGLLRIARVMGDDLGMVSEILAEDDAAVSALWSAVAGRRIGVHLDEMDERDPALRHIVDSPRWRASVNPGRPVMVIDVPQTGPGAVGLRSRGSRRRLRSTRRDFDEAGTPLSIDILSTADQLDANWDEMARLSAAGVSGQDRTDYLAPPLGDLVRSVLRREATAGRLAVATLAVGRTAAAQLFLVRSKNTFEGWLTHYDPEFADAQPGHQMMESLVDHAREIGVDRIDLGVGTNGFKEAWTTGEYRAVTVTALPTSMPGSALLVPALRRLESFSLRGLVARVRR